MPLNDNTAQWGVRRLTGFKGDNGIPVGFEYFSTNPNIPIGSLPLFGGEYSRTVYSDLWGWVQEQPNYLLTEEEWQAKASANDGNVPYYSSGDGSTTFRVPSLKCWVKGANGIEEVGSYLSAGLPNITGVINTIQTRIITPTTGAFSGSTTGNNLVYPGGVLSVGFNVDKVSFDASLSNPIYGNSDTVQPKSIVGMWLVKAYGTVTNVGSTDVASIAQGLTEAETRIGQLENHGAGATVVESYRNGTEWYRKWSDGWLEQGGHIQQPNNDAVATYTLISPFADVSYGFTACFCDYEIHGFAPIPFVAIRDLNGNIGKTTTSFQVQCWIGQGGNGRHCFDWYACGMGA